MNGEGGPFGPPNALTLAGGAQGNRIRAAVEAGDIVALVRAIVEPDHSGYWPAMDRDRFACPRCQVKPGQWILTAPAARLSSECVWICDRCRASGTRWGLARRVLEDPAALARYLTFVQTAA